jgi:hypothetical protein
MKEVGLRLWDDGCGGLGLRVMALLAPSSAFSALLGRSQPLCGAKVHTQALRIPGSFGGCGHGGVALSPFGVSGWGALPERIGGGCCAFSRSEKSSADLEGEGFAVEGDGEDESVVGSRGRGFLFSFLSNSATVGILAFTVAMVSRNRRPGFAATPAESVYVQKEEHVSSSPIEVLTPVSAVENEVF